jgi:hypothetical protein
VKKALLLFELLMISTIPSGLWGQQAGYFQRHLVANVTGVASSTDPQLLNPGGFPFFPGKISGSPTITAASPRSMTKMATKTLG